MKSYVDREMLRRRASFAHAASLGGLVILLLSVGLSLWRPGLTTLAAVLLFIGFAVSAIGVYSANRWVKRPRPEDVLDRALKSLSDQHRLYHYLSPCDHLLLTPGGLVVLETVNLDGAFSYRDGKWKQRMSFNRGLRFIFEERLGDPVERARKCCQDLSQRLAEKLPEKSVVPISAAVVFVNPAASLDTGPSNIPIYTPQKLQKALAKKGARLPTEQYQQIQAILDEAASSKSHSI